MSDGDNYLDDNHVPNDFKYNREIEVILTLFPSELTSEDIYKTIVRKLVNSYEKMCYDNMFIEEITNIFPIVNGKVGSNGEVNYKVKFEATVLRPMQNDIMTGHIQKIITTGVFIQYRALRCFVKKQCFDPKEWNNLKQNDNLTVRLHSFRFQNFHGTLSCVGETLNCVGETQ